MTSTTDWQLGDRVTHVERGWHGVVQYVSPLRILVNWQIPGDPNVTDCWCDRSWIARRP